MIISWSKRRVSGQGLALVRNIHAATRELAGAGDCRSMTNTVAYCAVATPEALQRPAVRHLRNWLAREATDNPA